MNVWAKCTVLKCNALIANSKHSGVERLRKQTFQKKFMDQTDT